MNKAKAQAKQRIIYDNYSPWTTYPDDVLKEMAIDCEWVDSYNEITADMLHEWRSEQMEEDWALEWERLCELFGSETVVFWGSIGRWYGTYQGGRVGDFMELFNKVTESCDYWKVWDENGHLFLKCSHHDGDNMFEIKMVSKRGRKYLNNWMYSLDDKRSEGYVYEQIFKRYSTLPRFAQIV